MENQSMCIMNASVTSPCNHIIPEFISARKQGNQSLVCLSQSLVFKREYLVQKIKAAMVLKGETISAKN